MKKMLLGSMLLTIALFVFGCSKYDIREGSFAPVRIRDQNLPGTQIRWNNVSLLDASIKNKIFVEATNTRRSPTGALEAWAIFRNRTDYPLQLEARASFYDTNQAPVEEPSAWQRIYLPPNATAHFTTLFSTQINNGFYNIEVREGR